MKCEKCGIDFVGNFCPQCGNQGCSGMEVKRCRMCGAEYTGNFCGKCGAEANSRYMYVPEPKPKTDIMGIVSLVLGIIGLLSCGLFIIPSIVAIVLGAIDKKKDRLTGMAIAGLICGIIGLVIGFGIYFLAFLEI